MKKAGFTLIELMVYIGIVGIVVIVAGQAFSNSTKMRMRTENMIKANEISEKVGSLIVDDIAQTGAKTARDASTINYTFYVSSNVFMNADNGDYSSFNRSKLDDDFDSLTTRRMRYDGDGRFVAVEEVSWFAKRDVLYRKCKSVETRGSADPVECPKDGITVEIADHIKKFKAVPAKPEVLSGTSAKILPSADGSKEFQLIPRKDAALKLDVLTRSPEKGGAQITLSNFASNYDADEQKILTESKKANELYVASGTDDSPLADVTWRNNCTKITLARGTEYEISFKVPYVSNNKSRAFCPGMDHMTVGFRTSTGVALPRLHDFSFYPPVDVSASDKRTMRFVADSTYADVCMVFSFAMYSAAAHQGAVTISELSLSEVAESSNNYDESFYPTNAADKQNVKSMKVILVTNRNGETDTVSFVSGIPSNGKIN